MVKSRQQKKRHITCRYLSVALIPMAAILVAAAFSYASEVQITITGTVSGTDTSGTFGSPGSITGPFTAVIYADDSKGVPYLGTWPTCDNGLTNSGLSNPVPRVDVTINGGSYTFGQFGPTSLSSWVYSANYSSPKTEIYGNLESSYSYPTTQLHGADTGAAYASLNSISSCRNWESAFGPYTLVSGDGGDALFSADVYNDNTDVANFSLSATAIDTVTVSGPITPPTLATTSGQNYGCNGSCPAFNYQQSAVGENIYPNVAQGDPINAAVGNMVMHETDFVGGPATHLSFTRYYNSLDTSAGPFGVGWHSNYHRALGATTTAVTVTRADGRQDVFTLSGSIWVPQANVTSALISTTSPSGYQLTWPDDTVENYNSSGQLTSIVERSGLTTSLAYTTSGLHTVTGPFGHTLTFTYDSSNRVSTMTQPDGTNKFTYGYDGWNNLAYVQNPDATAHQFAHGAWPFTNLITSLIDEDGNPYASWSYDPTTGLAVTSQLAAGVNQMSLNYTTTGVVTATNALGYTTSYSLTTNSGLVQPSAVYGVPDLSAGGASFTYDANGFVASVTDYNGNVTNYTHNSQGEETSRTEAYGTALARTTTTKWSGTWHLPTEIDAPLGRTTTFGYDANGNLLSKSETDGTHSRTWNWTYNGNGQVTSASDPLGNTTSLSYTTSGYLATMTNALGQTTTYNGYDGNGRLLSMTSPLGLTTTYTYDKLGRMLTQKTGGLTTTYTWDAGVKKISEIKLPDSSTITYSFDDAHRTVEVEDLAGDATKYTYDAMSNLTAVNVYNPTPTLKLTHSYTYDSANRMLTSVGSAAAETTTYGYDSQSNLISVTDPLGNTTTNAYDALNRLAGTTDALGNTTTYAYDALDDLVTVTDPLGLTTTYTWDGIGDRLSVVSPDTGTVTSSYNAAGLALTTTDARGDSASYTYDALNRTSTVSYSGGASIGYTYDTGTYGTGHLTKMVDPAGTTTWTYDQYGNVLTKSQTANALTLTTTYTYDSDERLHTIKYPSAKTVTYAYDSSGRVSSLALPATDPASSVVYLPFGMASGWTEANSSTYARTFDQDGRITAVTLASTTTGNTQTLTYDNASRITGLTETGLSGKTYAYDALGRTTTYLSGTTTTLYSYDANGNRASTTALGTTTTYTYPGTSNQLSQIGSTTTYGYDASGNATSDSVTTYTYDARGRMATATAGTTTAAYGVNGFGQRITKNGSNVPSGNKNEFVYDEQGNLIGEYSSTGAIIEETIYLPNTPVSVLTKGWGIAGFGAATPVAVSTSSATYSVTADWLNAPHIIQNSSKTVAWNWDHYAFGDNAPNQNPFSLGTFPYNLRFPGQYADAESGLNYNVMRDYGSLIGRYVESDPMGLQAAMPGSYSTYPYVGSNPLTRVDPKGLYSDEPCTATEGAGCNTGGHEVGGPNQEIGPINGLPQGEGPSDVQPTSTGNGPIIPFPSSTPLPYCPPSASNQNSPPDKQPQERCPFIRSLPSQMSYPNSIDCIYQCSTGQRIVNYSNPAVCQRSCSPTDGKPYIAISPIQ